jgi:predicted RNA-binding Zn-ribbon protein involved in translation (DUF1610 family)
MDRATFGALPVGTVLTSRSACPDCGRRGGVEVTIVLIRQENAAVSGHNAIPMTRGANYLCTNCGATGPAEPKEDPE